MSLNVALSSPLLRIIEYQPPAKPGEPLLPRRLASRGWVESEKPASMDGALEVPQFYADPEERRECHAAARAAAGLLALQDRRAPTPDVLRQSPSPAPAVLTSPTPELSSVSGSDDSETGPACQRIAALPPAEKYLLQVSMNYVEHTRGAPAKGSKVVPKACSVTKMVNAPLRDTTRAQFVQVFLDAHCLGDQYAAGPLSGPQFRLWWTGVNKSAAFTIENDDEFTIARTAILSKRSSRVGVEFNQMDLNGFHVRPKRPLPFEAAPQTDAEDELLSGTGVPRVEHFPDCTQLHGSIIIDIQKHHICKDHPTEHNAPGHCYKPAGSTLDGHVRLNLRRFKAWAAAVAAGEATKFVPPNTTDFEGGQVYYASPPYNPWVAYPGHQYAPMAPPLAYSSGYMPRTPSRQRPRTPPSSPLPARDQEIHQFLVALLAKRDVDLLSCEAALTAQDFTPDILPDVALARLVEVTGAVEGRLMKMQQFAKDWVARQQEKCKASL
ncbi:hypothetical protein OH76DRAFT_1419438 [Lentinus brumalis]|uniref:Uncharacterized protein n=1 Tax=Lentinus brumalis TaxID=2498619 RepID=A0A371D5K3_9APHY|nr:hypothetical protein OH76DRAFT_1419438 [Polyporus brumalis]